jgi:hypothetical protein
VTTGDAFGDGFWKDFPGTERICVGVVVVEGRRGGALGSVEVAGGSLGRTTGVGGFEGREDGVDEGMFDDNCWD